jgi:hypothetical protein
LILCYVPNVERDIVAPLRKEGFDDAAITGLGMIDLPGVTASQRTPPVS